MEFLQQYQLGALGSRTPYAVIDRFAVTVQVWLAAVLDQANCDCAVSHIAIITQAV
jgi:hypothetical protein